MYILGLSCYLHNSAATLIKDGKLIAAAEEERFTRRKNDREFPINAIKYCLEEAGITISDVEHIGYFWKPYLMLRKRFFGQFLRYFPDSLNFFKDRRGLIASHLGVKKELKRHFSAKAKYFHFIEHHMAHAASSFLASPFSKAAVLTIDGTGEWATTMLGIGEGKKIKVLKRINYPHSLGLMYGAVTEYLGFKELAEEGKVMGLAASGSSCYNEDFKKIAIMDRLGGYKLDLSYFNYYKGDSNDFVSSKFINTFGPMREKGQILLERHKDIAKGLQYTLEETVLCLLDYLYDVTKERNLCLAGGVALNCLLNAKILKNSPFKNVFIQPAAYDPGTSLGSAFYVYNTILGNPRDFVMEHAYWGPEFTDEYIRQELERYGLGYSYEKDIAGRGAELLAEGKILGWFQGRMEFGPRALGNRSILADPRRKELKDILNRDVKGREDFQPFAASILEEKVKDYFECDQNSPFMLLVFEGLPAKKDAIPAVIHSDGTSRVQTVKKETNPIFWRLIKAFEEKTEVPLVLNTSFNSQKEPIVCYPESAINCFLNTRMDNLIIGNFLVNKN